MNKNDLTLNNLYDIDMIQLKKVYLETRKKRIGQKPDLTPTYLKSRKLYASFDIGGHAAQFKIHSKRKPYYTGQFTCYDKEKEDILKCIAFIANNFYIKDIFIACPGVVNSKTGEVLGKTGIKNWSNSNIIKEIKKYISIKSTKVYIINDASAALMGLINHKTKGISAVLTIGTGIGFAFSFNNKIIIGRHGNSGEIGNWRISKNENYIESEICSTSFFMKKYSLLKKNSNKDNFQDIFDKYTNDKEVINLINEWCDNIAYLILKIDLFLGFEQIYLCGGVTNSLHFKKILLDKIKDVFLENNWANIKIEFAKKGINYALEGVSKLKKNNQEKIHNSVKI